MSGTRTPRKQRAYSVREKRAAVRRIEEVGVEEVAREISCARGTVHGWWKQADKLFSFTGAATSKTLKGQGRKEMFPAVPALVTFMKDKRREEKALTTRGMMEYMWQIDAAWIDNYMVGKKSGLLALQRLVQRLAFRHGFTPQKPQTAKKSTADLEQTRAEFAIEFWGKYEAYGPGGMLNVDETAINFDMPPARIWAGRGRRDPARIANASKHAGRMTAVLTVRADGKKLPILFIARGKPGGRIEATEFDDYPEGHFYTVQESAWMDAACWRFYVERLLKYEVDGPAVLILDNFECHVSEEGQRVVTEVANALVVPLPPNSTASCQPLDVGVMGPLKAKMRTNWSGITGGTAKEKRIRAVRATIAAFDAISKETVIRSFEKAIPRYPEISL